MVRVKINLNAAQIVRIIFVFFVCVFFIFGNVGADYSFEIPTAQTTVEVESDGSMTIFVEYEVHNLGQKIDYIDIGLPNNNYTLSDVQVMLNGETNSNIKVTKADYEQTGLRYGVSLEMGKASIATGDNATVSVWIPNLRKNLFNATSEKVDEEEQEFAGFQFTPNYFDSKYVRGKTKYSFIIVFPPDVSDGLAYYYSPEHWVGDDQPEAWMDEDYCVVYEWYSENADMHSEYVFGGKFIKSALTSPNNITSASGGGSSSGSIDLSSIFETLACIFVPIGLFVWGTLSIIKKAKKETIRSSKNYFPPQIKTDGEGIKRGLTAVEAAVLLETDMERVISMVLYGLAKKDVIQVKSMDPIDVDIVDPLPEGLYEYETNFIEALRESNDNKRKTKMRDTMHRLILSVSKKVEGFSLKETKEYYQSICDKAWEQVEAADTPELKSKLLGDNFGWAMLENDPEKRVNETFTGYEFYPPRWWWRVDPGYRRPMHQPYTPDTVSSGGSSDEKRSGSFPSTPTPMPVLPGAMFARSITDGARQIANSLVGNPKTFQTSIKNRTNPSPVYSSSSSSHRHGGGSSGRSSSCACACACDSCACACAGGGR